MKTLSTARSGPHAGGCFAAICALALLSSAHAADWPQYRGANHDGASTESLFKSWPASLTQVWKTPLTAGFSSITIADGLAATQVTRDGMETLVVLDAKTGKELWARPMGIAKFDGGGESGAPDNNGGDGSRSTPTFDGGRVYALDAHLLLSVFDAKTGEPVWSKNFPQEFGSKLIQWQNAASPLIDGALIFVNNMSAQGSLMALNKKDGSIAWRVENDKAVHATPIAATVLGTRQIIFVTQSGLVSLAPKDGAVLWRYNLPFKTVGASPVISGDIVYCSAVYNSGAGCVKISKDDDAFKATELWRQPGNANGCHWTTPVVKDGYLYGIFDQARFGVAALRCLELETGKQMWSQSGYGPGGLLLAGGNVVALNDRGELVLVEGNPAAYKELGRQKILDGKCWNSPAISNGQLFARSTKEGVCLAIGAN